MLLASFTEDIAYFVAIVAHPTPTSGWATQDVFNIAARNWPREGLVRESRTALGLSEQYSDDDRRTLRNAGITTLMEVDGKVYAPGRLGQTTAGTPSMITRRADLLMRQLQLWREDFDGMLEKARIDERAYWTPDVQTPRPGFEEYAGFTASTSRGAIFLPAARII